MNQIIVFILCYLACIIMTFLLISNWLQRGFFWKWLRVRMSGRKKILIRAHTMIKPYYRIGKLDEGFLVFKDLNKEVKRINCSKESIIYDNFVDIVDVDSVKNAVISKKDSFDAVPGFDAVRYNDLYKRALYKPQISDNKTMILILMILAVILLTIVLIAFQYKTMKNTEYIITNVNVLRTMMSNVTVSI